MSIFISNNIIKSIINLDLSSLYIFNTNITNHSLLINGINPIIIYTENIFIQNTQFINLYKNHNNSLQNIIIKDSIFKSHLNSFYLNINKNDDINIINSELLMPQ